MRSIQRIPCKYPNMSTVQISYVCGCLVISFLGHRRRRNRGGCCKTISCDIVHHDQQGFRSFLTYSVISRVPRTSVYGRTLLYTSTCTTVPKYRLRCSPQRFYRRRKIRVRRSNFYLFIFFGFRLRTTFSYVAYFHGRLYAVSNDALGFCQCAHRRR